MILTQRRRLFFATFTRPATLALFGLLVARTGAAAPIIHGNFPGATVDYLGVQEESATDPGPALFGAPTVAGDSMDFNPINFAATTTSAGGSDQTDSNLKFAVKAHFGQSISSIFFAETGDTGLVGFTGDALTSVFAHFEVEIAEVNNLPFSANVPPVNMSFNPNGGTYQLSLLGPPIFNSGWAGSILIDLGPTIAANNITGAVTKVNVSIDNRLSAASSPGASAFIQKKDADGLIITVETQDTPEPASAVLASMALAMAGGLARRRR